MRQAHTKPATPSVIRCLFELAKGLEVGLRLRVVLSSADRGGFETMLVDNFGEIASVLSEVDARTAQVTNAADRQYILPQIEELPEGLGSVTKTAQVSLRAWLVHAGIGALDQLPAAERGTSVLIKPGGVAAA